MLKAFIDDSGTNLNERVVAVAGFVAGERQWESFEQRWGKFLEEYDLPRFHAANYLARGRPYNRWCEEKYKKCGYDVCEIFKYNTPFGVGNTVDIEVFNEWRYNIGIFINPDPYYFCLDLCLRSLIRGISEVPNDEGVLIYIDQDKGRENLGNEIANWHTEYLRRNPPERINKDRTVNTVYVSSRNFLPLQAADVLVHGSFQRMKDFLKTQFPHPEPPENAFLQAMRNQQGDPLTIRHFHCTELLDIEFRKMISGSDLKD